LESRDQLAEAQGVAHIVCVRKRTRDAESLALEQASGSRRIHGQKYGKSVLPYGSVAQQDWSILLTGAPDDHDRIC
jgi:hypothetical protein